MDWDKVNTIGKYDLHRADIILVDGKTWKSSGIKWGTWSPVSHVAMCTGFNQVVESLGNGPTTNTHSTDPESPPTDTLEGWLEQLTHALVMRHKDFGSSALQDQVCDLAIKTVGENHKYDMDKIYQLAQRYGVSGVATGGQSTIRYWAQRRAWNKAAGWTDKKHVAPGYPAGDDNAFICSEFVVRMYERVGKPIIDAACWVAPCDFISVGWDDKPYPTDDHLSVVGKLK